jgi:hypothetical protein
VLLACLFVIRFKRNNGRNDSRSRRVCKKRKGRGAKQVGNVTDSGEDNTSRRLGRHPQVLRLLTMTACIMVQCSKGLVVVAPPPPMCPSTERGCSYAQPRRYYRGRGPTMPFRPMESAKEIFANNPDPELSWNGPCTSNFR